MLTSRRHVRGDGQGVMNMVMDEFMLGVSVAPGDETVVALSGELDFFTTAQLRAAVAGVWRDRPQKLIIDLADLTFIDPRGIDCLIEIIDESRDRGMTVDLRHHSPAVERLATLLHIDEGALMSGPPPTNDRHSGRRSPYFRP